jgi:hypothetical protein
MLENGASLQDCLKRFPNETWLVDELRVVQSLSQLKVTPLTHNKVELLEHRLKVQFNKVQALPKAKPRPVWFMANRLVASVLLVFVLALVASGGTVAASSSAMPNQTLYPVKRAWENFIVTLASLIGRLAEVWAHLAQVRYEELLYMQALNNYTDLPLQDFNAALFYAQANANPNTVSVLTALMNEAQTILNDASGWSDESAYVETERLIYAQFDTQSATFLFAPTNLQPLSPTPVITTTPSLSTSATPITNLIVMSSSTPTLTATITSTIFASPTSRFQATATRVIVESSATPMIQATLTPSITPSLTPLAFPQGIRQTATPTPTNLPIVVFTATPLPNGQDPVSPFVRETFEAVYQTQTAEAQATEPQ